MLVLTRRMRQSIYIGDDICVTVLDVGPTYVRIGVEAPGDVPIAREEIASQDLQEKHRYNKDS